MKIEKTALFNDLEQTDRILVNIIEIYENNGLFKQFYKLIEEEAEAHTEFFKIEWLAQGFKKPHYIPETKEGQRLKEELLDVFIVLMGIIAANIGYENAFNFMEYKTKRQLIRDDKNKTEEEKKAALNELELWAVNHVYNTF